MPMRLGTPFPGLSGATEWIGVSDAPTLQTDAPILIHFWAVSCHICHETMGSLIALRDTYVPKGLQLVSIHMPRQESDTEVERVHKDIAEYNLTQPIAVDNLHKIAESYQNEFVPAYFLFDREGNLKFRAAGDKGLQNVDKKLAELFGES
jgi:thiol-disulfide isomerase/thioredoxin